MSDRRFEHGYALLVGVGEHKAAPQLSLPVTVKDVQALQKTLLEPDLCAYPSENIQLLVNQEANNSGVISGLRWLKEKAKGDPQATVIIYYSGHGWVSPTGDYYLITQDALPDAVTDTAFRATAFANVLRDIAAERVLIVLDCCHAEGMAEAKSLKGLDQELSKGLEQGNKAVSDVTAALAQGKGRAVFSSSLGNESSYFFRENTMSVFTYHFVEALQGAGHGPGDTEVTIASLMHYVSRTVPETVEKMYRKDQHPFFEFKATNFPVALMRGGKGLPTGGWEEVKPSAERYLRQLTQQATLTGSGAIAQGAGAIAIGRGAVHVDGSNVGSINTGTQINTGGGGYVGGNASAGRDFVGRDQFVTHGLASRDLESLFAPLMAVVAQQAPAETLAAAVQQVQELKAEVTKGAKADDTRLAKIVDSLAGMVPDAIGTVVSMFASPILGGIAGPVAKFVLARLQDK